MRTQLVICYTVYSHSGFPPSESGCGLPVKLNNFLTYDMKYSNYIISLMAVVVVMTGVSLAVVFGYENGRESSITSQPIIQSSVEQGGDTATIKVPIETNTALGQRDLSDNNIFRSVDVNTDCTRNVGQATLLKAKESGFIINVNYKNYLLASTCTQGSGDKIDYLQLLNIPTEQNPKTSSWSLAVLMQGSDWRYYDFTVNIPMSDNLSCELGAGGSADFATINCSSANGGAIFSGQINESYSIDLTTGKVTLVYSCNESPIVIKTPEGGQTAIYDRKCATNFVDKSYGK